jgi:hypothetical protein
VADRAENYADLWTSPPPENLYLLRSPDGFFQPVFKHRGSSEVISIDDPDVCAEVVKRMREVGVRETNSLY